VEANGNNAVGTLLVEERNQSLVSCWESWQSYSVSKLLCKNVARRLTGLVTGIVASYIEPPSDKALGESLLREQFGKK
jgi:hypothetical protein